VLRFSPRPNRAELVRWREWGEDAFEEAAEQGKLIALFITAFWCGFCQRMDETSLSDDDVITLLNAFFIPIRVEESQRPDVDLRYNQNGWPTISFFTPKGVHLASLNYTPPEDFIGFLVRLVDQYQQNTEAILDAEPDAPPQPPSGDNVPLKHDLVEEVAGILEGLADHEFGGYGLDLKLLHPEANDFALYLYEARGERHQLDHVMHTLNTLRQSRTFDAANGGFFRYSSRRDWQEPHPEKLLQDQADLLSSYLDTYLLSGDDSYRQTAKGLITYLEDVLTTDETRPGFAGCQDYLHGSSIDTKAELPFVLDQVIYCDANAAAASAYLKAWWLLGDQNCRTHAIAIIDFLWSKLRGADGSLRHYSWGGESRVPGLLADALSLGNALLDAHSTLGGDEYLARARELAEHVVEGHRCPDGGFYDIANPGAGKLAVPLTLMTENAAAALFFTRLADLSREPAFRDQAHWALRRIPNSHREYGAFAAVFGHAVARFLSPPLFVDLAGTPGAQDTVALLRAARTQLHHPNLVLRFHEPKEKTRPGAAIVLTDGQTSVGPVTDPTVIGPRILASG
jgi:uncharacterized protein YyaL (SSP411 family)